MTRHTPSFFLLALLSIATLVQAQNIFDAIRSGSLEQVQALVSEAPQLVNAKNTRQSTPLHVAVSMGNEAMTRYLIEKGADINSPNRNGMTPLFFANSTSLAGILVAHGADIDYGYPHYTPIINALTNKNKDVAEYFLTHGAKLPDSDTPYGPLTVISALKTGSVLYLDKCVEQGFDPRYEYEGGNNLLHYASEGNSIELIDKLLGMGVSPNRENAFGHTPLHVAARSGNLEAVRIFVNKGLDIDARTNDGKTPLNYADEARQGAVAEFLRSSGADQDPQRFPALTGPYLGQPRPGRKAVPFAPGIVSGTHLHHGSIVLTPDGNQLFWSAGIESKGREYIFTTRVVDGKWTKPELFSEGDVPHISPNGNRLFFVRRQQTHDTNREAIFARDKTPSGWSEPYALPDTINQTPGIHWQVSVDSADNLYFGAGGTLYCSQYVDGRYTTPTAIESLGDLRVFAPHIAPDGSYLLATKEGEGEQLIVLYRDQDDTWSEPIDITDHVGVQTAFCPVVTRDNRYLFFISGLGGMYVPYWVDASFIEELRPDTSENHSSGIRPDKAMANDHAVYTILYNNVSGTDSVIADHGFSCLIDSGDHSCLFDTGRNSDYFMSNVRALGVDVSTIDQVFISHIHDDHMGGLFDILAECSKPTLHLPFSYPEMPGEPLGEEAVRDFNALLERLRPLVSEIVRNRDSVSVGDRFYTTGAIEFQTYEHALIVPTSRGLILITGCAHPGILEMVKRARELAEQDVYLVMGGFHLVSTDPARVVTLAQELRNLTRYVGPCHCTGESARRVLKDIFQDDYIDIQAGMKITIGEGNLK